MPIPSVRPSVCLSVTRVYCIKTAKRIIEILSLSDRPIILVFRHQGSLRKSDGFTPNGGAKYKWLQFSTNMRLYLGKGTRYRHTMEDESYMALWNSATFDDLE